MGLEFKVQSGVVLGGLSVVGFRILWAFGLWGLGLGAMDLECRITWFRLQEPTLLIGSQAPFTSRHPEVYLRWKLGESMILFLSVP